MKKHNSLLSGLKAAAWHILKKYKQAADRVTHPYLFERWIELPHLVIGSIQKIGTKCTSN